MIRTSLTGVLALALGAGAAGADAKDDLAKELKLFEGTWKVTSMVPGVSPE